MVVRARRVALVAVFLLGSAVLTAFQLNLETVGPRVGARVPEFAGVDQFGRKQTLQTVLGPAGAMLVFFRSADW